jgi:Flp pilus assembly protein TadG
MESETTNSHTRRGGLAQTPTSTILRGFLEESTGAVLVFMAVMMAVFVSLAVMAVDVGKLYVAEADLQAAADAAALAGASQLSNADTTTVRTQAKNFAVRNMPSATYGTVLKDADVVRGSWDTAAKTFTPGGTVNAVRVTTRLSSANSNAVHLTFGGILNTSSSNVTAHAVAVGLSTGTGCALGLDPSASQTILVEALAQLNLDGCGVYSNSTSKSAIECALLGSIVGPAVAVGGVSQFLSGCGTSRKTGAPVAADPYASVSNTPPANCLPGGTVNQPVLTLPHTLPLSPGRYCGGIDVENGSTLNLSPGVYYIDSKFTLENGTTLNATGGVTIILDGTFQMIFAGIVNMNITAPTSGPTSGIALMGPRNGSSSTVQIVAALATLTIQGAIYFPSQTLRFVALANVVSASCTQIIADKLDVQFVSSLRSDCNSAGTQPIGGSTKLRLVQ